jgi:hypothetical protein
MAIGLRLFCASLEQYEFVTRSKGMEEIELQQGTPEVQTNL